ncbi:hypothetical protein NMG60_11027867 [Bertholletia excelsa]
MAPNREALTGSYTTKKPEKLSMEGLQRTLSDFSFELTKEISKESSDAKLPPISEVEDARCECCGMSEECTPEYIDRVRSKFSGKLVCGLCAEAVKEEMEKNGGKREEALTDHMNTCARFNRLGRAYPVLFQAEAVREILKKSPRLEGGRSKSISPRDRGGERKGGIARSSSCIASITREIRDPKMVN